MTSAIRLRSLLPHLAIAGLFVMCGVGFWNNILLFPKLAQFFGIDNSLARYIQVLYSIGYLLSALPSALFHRKYGYKIGMIFALGLVSVGPFLIYPAIAQHGAAFFLVAVVLLGAGWSTLETSLNALVVEMGRPETAVRRLNFVQALFPVGLVIGYIMGRWLYPSDLHLSFSALAETAARPYIVVGLAVLFLAFLLERVEFPARSGIRSGGLMEGFGELRTLLADRSIVVGAVAIFCCIAIQSTLQGANYQYVTQQYPGADYIQADNMVFLALIVFGVGRFVGTALMGRIEPGRLYLYSVILCLAFTVGALAFGGVWGFYCLMATNIFMGIGYPTIFAATIKNLRSSANVGAGILVTASGASGLVIPLAMNFVIEAANARVSLLMALPCFALLLVYAVGAVRPRPAIAVARG